MGQYYKFIILDKDNKSIVIYLNPHDFGRGAKLMENAYLSNPMIYTIEFLLSQNCIDFYKSYVVFAGDYAEPEKDKEENLYTLTDWHKSFEVKFENPNLNYIVNHTKKLYVDKTKLDNEIHPLLILISEGNERGGGDYDGYNVKLAGTWARNLISMESVKPDDYNELICNFEDY